MKKSMLFLCLLALPLGLGRCSSDPVQNDLIHYVNVELPRVADDEKVAVNAYDAVSGPNYSSDEVMYEKIKAVVLPKYTDFSLKLQAITPGTGEVKLIHNDYVKASQDQLEAFKLILHAIEKQDVAEVKQANEDLIQARNLAEVWKEDLQVTCRKHNVTLGGDKKE